MTLSSVKAWLDNTAPPCEKFTCENFMECAEQLLACEAFDHFVQSGHAASPRINRNLYNNGKIFATRAIYRKIYQEWT